MFITGAQQPFQVHASTVLRVLGEMRNVENLNRGGRWRMVKLVPVPFDAQRPFEVFY